MFSAATRIFKVPKGPLAYLVLMAAGSSFSFALWQALLNNFTVEVAGFTGSEIGTLQSLREVPGFFAFTVVFALLVVKQQTLAVVSVAVLGLGVALTGFFPSVYGLYFTTVLMSVGFHYFETMQMSLSLQWFSAEEAPKIMGQQISARSVAALLAFAILWVLLDVLNVGYVLLYVIGGLTTVALALYVACTFPQFKIGVAQERRIHLRKRYWLFYALTFMGGARRQIFVVFAGFLLVTKFDFTAAEISGLYLVNQIATALLAPKLGALIGYFGERNALIFEYIGLIGIFLGYAYASSGEVAALFFVLDHLFFAFAIAQKSYLKKIADPSDLAVTSSVSFSINHIAAVIIPWLFGVFVWAQSPALVFVIGAGMAGVSLVLALNVPRHPAPGNEVHLGKVSRRMPVA
ncbi:MAG: MFS transporter [Kordiimonadaceae bacterium]|nr:MFS transporter [Kordiimonadaceae bacterium]